MIYKSGYAFKQYGYTNFYVVIQFSPTSNKYSVLEMKVVDQEMIPSKIIDLTPDQIKRAIFMGEMEVNATLMTGSGSTDYQLI